MLRRLAWLAALATACSSSGSNAPPDTTVRFPSAPGGVTATPGHGFIRLSWSPVAGATDYVVYSAVGATLDPATATSRVLAGAPWDHEYLEDGTTYAYAVRARRDGEAGALSGTVTAVPLSALDSLVAQPDALVLEPGHSATVALVATYLDTTSEDVTGSATWTVEGAATFSVAAGVLTVSVPADGVGPSALNANLRGLDVRVPVGARRSGDRVAFVTSRIGNSNLSTWTDVTGGETGLVAADAICQTRAGDAGLPGTFTAWLSDASDDAWCRVHGMSGKKAASCGQPGLPASAGPWVRADGFPFAPAISQMASSPGVVFVAIADDERGRPLHASEHWFNSTSPDGTYLASTDCGGWTSASYGAGTPATTDVWDAHLTGRQSSYSCGSDNIVHLLCLEQGSGPALPAYQTTGKLVFVSSASGAGDLSSWADAGGASGVAAGDAVCRALAGGAGLDPSKFKALLSAEGQPASGRVTSDGPWVRGDGVVVARNRADLLNQRLFTAVAFDETGARLPVDRIAFTGLWADGGASPNGTCTGWTAATGTAQGQPAYNGSGQRGWQILCSGPHALLCIED